MKIFAIGDLHLAHAVDKPMDVFGRQWKDHTRKIEKNWREKVGPADLVLVPGDLSWGMRMEEVEEDLDWLDRLPGRKVLIKGNHDYWWPSISRLRARLRGTTITALQYDSARFGPVTVGGTRLWSLPGEEETYADPLEPVPPSPSEGSGEDLEAAHDERLFRREVGRLKLSLESMDREASLRIVMTHYPPTTETGAETVLTRMLEEAAVDICVFGHLHNLGIEGGKTWDFVRNGVRYVLVSCDAVDFSPYFLIEVTEAGEGIGGAP